MTDLLLKPDDTGDIPTGVAFDPSNPGTHAWDCDCDVCPEPGLDVPTGVGEKTVRLVGERTENLAPYAAGLPPAMRRPTVMLPIYVRPVPEGEVADRPAPVATPVEGPPTDATVPTRPHIGRHRRPSRWDWLTVPLAMAVQRIGRAL